MTKRLEPICPGEILLEGFMKPLGMSINKLAGDIHVPLGRISEIVRTGSGRRSFGKPSVLRTK
jgi:addiction module HigA family antidote